MEFLLCTKVSGAGDKSFLNTRNVVFFFFFFFCLYCVYSYAYSCFHFVFIRDYSDFISRIFIVANN